MYANDGYNFEAKIQGTIEGVMVNYQLIEKNTGNIHDRSDVELFRNTSTAKSWLHQQAWQRGFKRIRITEED